MVGARGGGEELAAGVEFGDAHLVVSRYEWTRAKSASPCRMRWQSPETVET